MDLKQFFKPTFGKIIAPVFIVMIIFLVIAITPGLRIPPISSLSPVGRFLIFFEDFFPKSMLITILIVYIISCLFALLYEKSKEQGEKGIAIKTIIVGIILIIIGAICFGYYKDIKTKEEWKRISRRELRIMADMSQLRGIAVIYFDEYDSYINLKREPDVLALKDDIIVNGGEHFAININPDGSRYCAEVQMPSGRWYCLDSELVAKEYISDPICSSNYYTCEEKAEAPEEITEEEITNRKRKCAESKEPDSCYMSLAKELRDPCVCDEIKFADPHLQCRKEWIDYVAPLRDSHLCDKFENCTRGGSFYKYECYRRMAGRDPSICDRLDTSPFRNSCYIKVAFDLKEPSVCNNLVEIDLKASEKDWPKGEYFPKRAEYLNSKEVCVQISQEPEPWRIYQNKEYGWEISYPNNFIVKKSNDRVVFTSPENIITLISPEIELWGGKYYSDFIWIRVEKVDVGQALEEWVAKELGLKEFKEFEISPEESGWNIDSVEKIIVGENIPAVKVHGWAQAYDYNLRYIKYKNIIIAIENDCFSGSENTSIFNQMLSTFRFLE